MAVFWTSGGLGRRLEGLGGRLDAVASRLDALDGRPAAQSVQPGLPVGAFAPPFRLPRFPGEPGGPSATLDELRASGRAVLSSKPVTPSSTGTVTLTWSASERANVLAASTFALNRRPAGVSGETFTFYTEACPSTGGNCYDAGTDAIYVPDDDDKFLITKEMGNKIAVAVNGGVAPSVSYSARSTDCPWSSSSQSMTSEEFQSAAIHEGLASYYAAIIWNKDSDSDCMYIPNSDVDWTQDGVGDTDAAFSCIGGNPAFGVPDNDFMGTYCLAVGAVTDRGTHYDWMRNFWYLDHTEGLSTADIFDIWAAAGPDSWTASGAGTGPGFPAYEMEQAANGLGTASAAAWAALESEDDSSTR